MSGVVDKVRVMNRFEHMSELMEQALLGQRQVCEMLDNALVTSVELDSLLAVARNMERLTELLTIKLVKQLQLADAFHPKSRASFNARMHKNKFTRGELKDACRLGEELFPEFPSVDRPEGRAARMPCTAAGLNDAAFGVASAMEIARVLEQAPEGTPAESFAYIESRMAEMARSLAPEDLRKAGIKILQGLNADSEPQDAQRQRRRRVTISAQGADLNAKLSGEVTPELKALLDRLFADYAGAGDLLPDGEKENDVRTQAQRNHDALVAALKYALHRNGPMPPTRGCSTVVATMTLEQLQKAAGVVPTDVGTLLSIPDLIRLGADRNAFLAILEEGTGNLIELGRTKRAADVYAYLGLVAAQGGDMTPGSSLPAALCEIHHVRAWRFGGLSEGKNFQLAGHNTHRNIDDTQTKDTKWWTVCTTTGQMLWIPPKHIDPERRPQANFNPMTWFNPGQMLRFGMHEPEETPPFTILRCPKCGKDVA